MPKPDDVNTCLKIGATGSFILAMIVFALTVLGLATG